MSKKKATQKKVEEEVIEVSDETPVRNYVIVDGQKSGQVAVKLLDPEFENVVIQFGKIGITEEDGRAILAFDYDLVSGELPNDASAVSRLEEQLGDTVVDLLENHFDEGEVVGGDD